MDEDYDIYGGAPWSAYHDDVDPWEAEYDRRAAEYEASAEEAEQILAEMRYYDQRILNAGDDWDSHLGQAEQQ